MTPTMPHFRPHAPLRSQAGVSLVELMVGITIGLLVVLAAVGSLVYTRTSSTTVGDSARLQQEAANAFRILGHHIRVSGARRAVDVNSSETQDVGKKKVEFNPNFNGLGIDPNTRSTNLVTGTDGAGTGPDTLLLSHDAEPDLGETDCLGELPKLPEGENNIQNRIFYSLNAQNVGELRCQGTGNTTFAVAAGLPLVQGIEDFQVWYGFQQGLLNNATLQYRTATEITSVFPPPWEQVVAIRVCLRMSGEATGNVGAATAGCLPNQSIAADGRIRRSFSRVFNIRNAGL
jgi:type IV pilus assembly protein PilW